MDRQDAKPRRPSLMAGAASGEPTPAASSPSPARILSDMDGGKPTTLTARSTPLQRTLILSAAGIGVLGLLWWWQAGRSEPSRNVMPIASATVDAAPLEAIPDANNGAATIIDESSSFYEVGAFADGGETFGPQGDPLISPFATADSATAVTPSAGSDASQSKADNPFASPVTGPVNKRAGAASASVSARAAPAARASARPNQGDSDLMSALLENIQTKGNESGSGLDSLIEKMEAKEAKPATRRSKTASATVPQSRSQQIQSNLRECPPANTAKGLKCRQDICAVYAGRDPACPAD